jgi:beta-glucosidase
MGVAPDDVPRTHIDWSIVPDAFHYELMELTRRYKLPIYVTENGCGSETDAPGADGKIDDQHRIDYLRGYTAAMARAIQDGADVRGYFAWSLLDNFEWSSGYAFRFGLIHVDFETQRRTPKQSARWYAELKKTNSGK